MSILNSGWQDHWKLKQSVRWWNSSEVTKSVGSIAKSVENIKNLSATDYNREWLSLFKWWKGDKLVEMFEEAIRMFEKAIELEPNNLEFYKNKWDVLLQLWISSFSVLEYKEAVSYFDQAIKVYMLAIKVSDSIGMKFSDQEAFWKKLYFALESKEYTFSKMSNP